MSNATQVLKAGWKVRSKKCGPVRAFDGIVVDRRGSGYQILDPQSGKTYQRDHYDLILPRAETSEHEA